MKELGGEPVRQRALQQRLLDRLQGSVSTLGRRPVGPQVRNAVAPSACQRVCHRLALCPETSSSRATSAWERPLGEQFGGAFPGAWRAAQ